MAMPVIPIDVPVTIPPIAEKVYPRYKLRKLIIDDDSEDNPNSPVVAIIKLHAARVDDNDLWELCPTKQPISLRIDDLLNAASQDMELAQAIGGVLMFVAKLAVEKLVTPPVPPPVSPAEPDPEE